MSFHSESEKTIKSNLQKEKVAIPFVPEANQPKNIKFPVQSFGKQTATRSFNSKWFDRFKWLHYDKDKDAAFCFTCIKASNKNLILSTIGEGAFIETGFRNWKNAFDKKKGFYKHESSECHKEATSRFLMINHVEDSRKYAVFR